MLRLLIFSALNYLFSALCYLKTAFLVANHNREIFSCILLCLKLCRHKLWIIITAISLGWLTIIPRARMGSESIARYWHSGHEGERNNCFCKIQLVGQKYRDKTTLASKTRFSRRCFGFQSRRFSLLVGYNIKPSTSSTNQNAALILTSLTLLSPGIPLVYEKIARADGSPKTPEIGRK